MTFHRSVVVNYGSQRQLVCVKGSFGLAVTVAGPRKASCKNLWLEYERIILVILPLHAGFGAQLSKFRKPPIAACLGTRSAVEQKQIFHWRTSESVKLDQPDI